MNDQEDQFFVQPEIEEVQDIRLLQEPESPPEKPLPEEPKHITLKMVEIPKPQIEYHYRPFHFEKQESQEQQDEEVAYDCESPFTEFYSREQLVYQRLRNEQFNRINETVYFSGAFLHRNMFLQGNCSQAYQLADAIKQYYDDPSEPQITSDQQSLVFDSRFESGNLFAAFKVGPFQYDLVMGNDVNSTGNNQWFYFSVEGMIPEKEYTFAVVNFTKSDSLFNYGMAPAVYSLAENKNITGVEKGWRRTGKQVSYKKGQLQRENSRRMYYRLNFKLSTSYEKDKLFIAHSYPYSCQKLSKYITDRSIKYKDIITKVTVGKTLGKRTIEGLLLSQPINKKRDNRKAIIVMARQHPGQTQGSYVCEGVIQKLLGKSKEADFLLKNYVVYVIPMVNPDGVAFGHYRTNLAGKDLNRKWNATQKDLNTPQVSSIKAFIQQISREREIRFILDLHGHSKKLNSFFYGNPCPENPDVVRIFPYVCSKLHSAVQFLDCTFAAEQYKRKAARVYLSFLYRLIHVYTFESSFYAYFKDGKKIEFTPKQYRQLGGILINALYMQLEHEVRFQQSFQFKKNNTKQYNTSPFVKLVNELKSNKELLEQGTKYQSGSQSKPEDNEVNNQDLESIKPLPRPLSTPNTQDGNNNPKTSKGSRKGVRDQNFNFNKPIRQIKFLQISRVNSILPDKYQLGLQPIKKKDATTSEIVIKPQTPYARVGAESQTEPRQQLRYVEFKSAQIQGCVLASSTRIQLSPQRKYSSVMRSNNRNIIFKFDVFGQTTARQQDIKPQKPPLVVKNAYSQTMITYSRQQGEKIKSSQLLPQVDTPDRDERRWARNNSIRVQSSLRTGLRRQAELFFNGMVKKLMTEKDVARTEQIAGSKFILEKPLSIKKKEISRK